MLYHNMWQKIQFLFYKTLEMSQFQIPGAEMPIFWKAQLLVVVVVFCSRVIHKFDFVYLVIYKVNFMDLSQMS